MGNIGPSSSPLMKLHLGSVYFILSTFFLHHMQYRVVIHMHSLHCILTKADNLGMDLILWVTPVLYQLGPFLFLHFRWRLLGQQLFFCQWLVEVLLFQVIPRLPYSPLNDISACSFTWCLILNIHIQPWLKPHKSFIRYNFSHGSRVMQESIWRSEIAVSPPLCQALFLLLPFPHHCHKASMMCRWACCL